MRRWIRIFGGVQQSQRPPLWFIARSWHLDQFHTGTMGAFEAAFGDQVIPVSSLHSGSLEEITR